MAPGTEAQEAPGTAWNSPKSLSEFVFFVLIIHEHIFYLNHHKLLPLAFNWVLLTCIYCETGTMTQEVETELRGSLAVG